MGLSAKLNLCLIISCLLTICHSAPELRGIRAEGNRLVNYRKEEINIKVRRTFFFFLHVGGHIACKLRSLAIFVIYLHIDNMTV